MTNQLHKSQQSLFLPENLKAIIALLTALIIWAFVPIAIRLGEREMIPNLLIFHRFWISTIILGLWNGFPSVNRQLFEDRSEQKQPYNSRLVVLLLAIGICFGGEQIIWAWSLTQTSIANSSLLHSLSPLFTTLGGWILFAQHFDKRFMLGIIVAILGSAIVGFDDLSYSIDKLQGDGLSLLSAFFLAGYFLFVEQVRTQFNTRTILLWSCTIGTLGLFPIFLMTKDKLLPSSWSEWLIVLLLASMLVFGYGLLAYSLKFLSSGLVATILLFDPVITAILAWAIFSETLDFYNLVAFPIVLGGIYLATTSQSAIKGT